MLGLAGLAGVADTAIVLLVGGGVNTGTLFPGLLGTLLILWAIARKLQWPVAVGAHWRRSRHTLYMGAGVFALTFAIVQVFIWTAALDWTQPEQTDWVIVMGAGLRHGQPSLVLRLRLEKALGYIQAHPACSVIVTGGRDYGETRSEAAVMGEWLEGRGVEPSRILVEDRATSTMENLRYSKVLLQHNGGPPPWNPAVVTSDFHVFRVRMLGERQGMNLQPVATSTPWYLLPNACLREYLAVIKSAMLDRG